MGLLNPAALLFTTLYAVLVLLYLWERRRRRVEVPSLLLWQVVPEEIVRANRFRPDFLFLLQLLLLTLLIAGLAQPYLRGTALARQPMRYVYILDGSASMQAREGRRTRFEEARDALRRRLEALADDDEAMIILAANRPRVVAAFSRDHAALVERLRKLTPVDTSTNLDVVFAVARGAAMRGDRPTRIEAFTDAPASELDPNWRASAHIVQVGETDDNLAIEGLEITQGRFQDPRDAHAQVVVRNFAHRESHGFLTLAIEGRVISRRGFSLPPRDARAFLVGDFEQPGVLRADLEVDDALAADNHASGWVRPPRPLRVLVVSDASPLLNELAAVANATPNLEFELVQPVDYHRALSANPDVVLFHHLTPDTDPERPALYLYPPTENPMFPVRSEASEVSILGWNEQHAVMRGLSPLPPFPLARVQILDVPPWGEVLLSSRSGDREIPLAFAGLRNGRRTACIAFDLQREHLVGADSVPFLLLLLNLLDWLAPEDASVTVLTTGAVHTLDRLPAHPRRVIDPHGVTSSFPANGPLTIEAVDAGEYEIEADGTRARLFANFFDVAESDIGRPMKEPANSVPPLGGAQRPAGGAPLSPWLYALAAGLFVVEWLVAARHQSQ